MPIGNNTPLDQLRTDFRATSTIAMPLAGLLCWAALGVISLFVKPATTGMMALYIMGAIMPVAFIIDRLRGRNLFAKSDNPLLSLFLLSILGIGLTVPLVIAAMTKAGDPMIMVLGMAILAGVIWIPFGWATDDRAGIIHAVGRAIGAYLAYALVPAPYTALAICAVVVLSYIYSLAVMKIGR